jgi:hypothetical protein
MSLPIKLSAVVVATHHRRPGIRQLGFRPMIATLGDRRTFRRVLATLAFLLASACRANAEPAQVIIIRHAEKPDEGNELSLRGKERAAALVPYFLGTDDVLQFKAPAAIYAQAPKKATSSIRSLETVQPLATALNLTVNQTFARDEYKNMVQEIMHNKDYDGRMVLICWEHKVIPEMAAEFGAEHAPKTWRGRDFDRTWVITFRPDKKPEFDDVPQHLIYGDSED